MDFPSSRYANGQLSDESASNCGEGSSSENESRNSFKRKQETEMGPAKFRRLEDADPSQEASPSSSIYSAQSMRMMNMMNFDKKKGLGKSGQGRTDIVQISSQKGRRGFGHKLEELDSVALDWSKTEEKITIPERVDWLENQDGTDISCWNREFLDRWIKYGKRPVTMDNEDKFCSQGILKRILECKSAFDKLDTKEMRKARTKSNPFETIKSNIFMNRAAVKMANLDAMFDYMFTKPVDKDGNSVIQENGLLYFADVCAGPGGFSEYVLWRLKWRAKGFGFTLKGDNDFKLHDFIAGTPETFHAYYGPKNNGDVFDLDNINGLEKYVLGQTEEGVHFMMADGGFSVDGNENMQEVLSKQLYLCQMLVALKVVRVGGHCVIKLFDLFTPFSVGLIYLMYRSFEKICICKPNSSRPANSERYLVCKWKKPGTEGICEYLYNVNEFLQNKSSNDNDIVELVPFENLDADNTFFEYVYNSNNEIGTNQINGLLKIAAFTSDETLAETRQVEIKARCLKLWRLEDNMRKAVLKPMMDQNVDELLKDWKKEKVFLGAPEIEVNVTGVEAVFPSVHGWYFVPIHNAENSGKNIRSVFIGRGGNVILQHNASNGAWTALKDVHLELPAKTLIYGEIVNELHGEGRSQITIQAFHIIDGIILGGVDIRKWSLVERLRMCELFAKALNKPQKTINNSDHTYAVTMPIRCKKLIAFSDLNQFFQQLQHYELKGKITRLGYNLRNTNEPDRFYVPRALLFLNETRMDYLKCFSKTRNRFYYFGKADKKSYFPEELPCANDTIASFKNTYTHRIIWKWLNPHQVFDENQMEGIVKDDGLLYRIDLERFLLAQTIK
ncbi:cap-specific mRNA (nucleoside-2'-O-)-methyltransferase 1 [Sabethes cyaneus]|uniref:cap-specific mRNA (nucleoside-2'-O-)-methyltransferase 1 n=1 Tax=Sabethes cyaneus TaxID=53552 RepID=UPI00237DDEE7|nr:cap-specific mRNA (nucleoside-2'-O-)-methyltransferase 1 [Sabethes cyaneus]